MKILMLSCNHRWLFQSNHRFGRLVCFILNDHKIIFLPSIVRDSVLKTRYVVSEEQLHPLVIEGVM